YPARRTVSLDRSVARGSPAPRRLPPAERLGLRAARVGRAARGIGNVGRLPPARAWRHAAPRPSWGELPDVFQSRAKSERTRGGSLMVTASSPGGLAGRVVLVTGASRGIGRAIALGVAGAGSDVVVSYHQ